MENEPYFPLGTHHEDVHFTVGEMNFVWDKAKNNHNMEVRGFDFQTAALVFNDEYCLFGSDILHSDEEERETVIGYPVSGIESLDSTAIGSIEDLLFVVFIERISRNGEEFFRIISARFATKKEEDCYMRNKLNS